MTALLERPSASISLVETRFRKGLWVASVLASIALGCYVATMLWAQNDFSGPETVVAAQSTMLAHDGTLYYDLKSYPYTVCAYTPLFYLLEAGLFRAGLPALLAGRVVSLAALAALIFLCFRIAGLYTRNRYAAWCAGLLAASSPLLMNWGTAAQVDTLACAFAAASFYYFSQFYLLNRRT